jgi:large subunit ribosomal protein L9
MKVVLTKDVRDMGRAGAVVEVSDGHAVNFLIPRKMAILATPMAVQQADKHKKQAEEMRAVDLQILAQNFASLAEARVVLTMKANEQGHLYESVSAKEIVDAVKASTNLDIEKDMLKLEKPIKEVGTFEIPLSSGELFGKFTLVVEAEV